MNTAPCMDDPRDAFRRWTECLLDPDRTPLQQLEAAQSWCEWGFGVLGIDENRSEAAGDPFFADTHLASGKAISPLGAARCVREYRRTAVFLQAMAAVIDDVRARFPGETIHVVEAGCGPLAPLALPFALRYSPEDVVFTLLDVHPVALEGARRVVQALGLAASIRGYVATDATTIRFSAADRPHLIACEVLLRALTREPQVAVTMNLAPQLRPGGVFVPQRIDVEAALIGSGNSAGFSRVADLGPVFSLDATAPDVLPAGESGRYVARSIDVPVHDRQRTPLKLMTRIQVFGEHVLGDMESSLNLPETLDYPDDIARGGGALDFAYEVSSDPGVRIVGCRVAGASPVEPQCLK